MRLGIIALCVALCGCVSTPAAPPSPPVTVVHVTCIPVSTWSKPDLAALASAMPPVTSDSPVWRMEKDWQAMRDAARACAK